MKLTSGKRPSRTRPEQSGYTFALAVFYSFFLHAAVVVVVLVLQFLLIPKAVFLPSYQVKLVGPPKESASTPAAVPAPPKKAMPETAKPSPNLKKAVVAVKKEAPKKDSMPDLTRQKKTPAPVEQAKSNEATPQKPPASPSAPIEEPATTGKKSEGVVVSSSSDDSKLAPYFSALTNRIQMNWNPPQGVKGVKAKVTFRVIRSGRVFGDATIILSSGNTYFDLAARRAILSSSPFPPVPDDFYKEYAEFTVDLAPEE
jgi:outer membrane biosynthesis protein TonB